MLTKDLLKFRHRGEYLKPFFVAVDDPELLELAAKLLAVYEAGAGVDGLTRSELEEMIEPLLRSYRDIKVAKGFNKLILDRTCFEQPGDYDYPAMRRKLFAVSAKTLYQTNGDCQCYSDALNADAELKNFIAAGIYADLPDNERLIGMKKIFSRELLERYNCSQVQSLLFYCSEMEVTAGDSNPAELRRLFKYLKFFRLLADITRIKPSGKGWEGITAMHMKISGPASIFENTRKYGLQLASFFPAICALEKWTVKAEIKLDTRRFRLDLDEGAGLVSHYRNFSAYVPEEIAMFHRLFKEKVADWTIVGDAPFIEAGGQEIIFPDLSFRHADGRTVHLELFHRWHAGPLLKRLEYCREHPELALIIGVDRSLAGDSPVESALTGDSFFETKGFLFRDFPGVDRVHKLLELQE